MGRRVALKLSGESFADPALAYGIDPATVRRVAGEIAAARAEGHEIAVVVGGGNIFRGLSSAAEGMARADADYMGMLATVMNALALREGLESAGCPARVQTAIRIEQVAEPYIRLRAIRHLEKGRVVIFAGGTGNPFFTTDTTAALRALEMNCEAVLKATKVDGVYSADPMKDKNATRYSKLSFADALGQKLAIMDAAAFTMCSEGKLPIIVFNFSEPDNLDKVLQGDTSIATVIS